MIRIYNVQSFNSFDEPQYVKIALSILKHYSGTQNIIINENDLFYQLESIIPSETMNKKDDVQWIIEFASNIGIFIDSGDHASNFVLLSMLKFDVEEKKFNFKLSDKAMKNIAQIKESLCLDNASIILKNEYAQSLYVLLKLWKTNIGSMHYSIKQDALKTYLGSGFQHHKASHFLGGMVNDLTLHTDLDISFQESGELIIFKVEEKSKTLKAALEQPDDLNQKSSPSKKFLR